MSIIAGFAGLAACSESTELSSNTISQEQRVEKTQIQEAVAARADFTAPSGRKLKYIRDVHDNRPEGEWENRQVERAARGKSDTDLTTLSREQLAEDFRGVSLIDGKEYVDAEPNWRVADLILAADDFGKDEPPGNPNDDGTPAPETLQGHAITCCGTDNRTLQRSNLNFPFSTQVAIERLGAAACSGTMIGPSTMISAAHCYHSGSGWYSISLRYYFGADKQDGTSSLEPGDYVQTTTCSWVTISGSFAAGNTDRSHDHAVVEFGGPHCSGTPGNSTGWLGTWAASDSQITDDMMYLYGYPGIDDDCPGNNCYFPSIWGIGNSESAPISSTEMKYKADNSSGQSGAGVYRLKDGYRYIVGINTHQASNWNKGRRVNTWLIGWMEDYSNFAAENAAWSLPSE